MHNNAAALQKTKNIALIVALFLLSAAVLIFGIRSIQGKTASGRLRISIDGQLYREEELISGKRIEVHQEDGSVNVILMTDDGFLMESSTCHNQLCIQQGEVTKSNYTRRTLGNKVICIPNRVTVELVLTDTQNDNPDLPDA